MNIDDAYSNYFKAVSKIKVPVYNAGASGSYYDAAEGKYRKAIEDAYQNRVKKGNIQAEELARQYEDVRRQTYVNSRLDSIGNNEKTAALGLAGNAYKEPRSGYSETSRIAENTAMRSDINKANRAEQDAKDKLAEDLLEAGYTKDIELARFIADISVKQAEASQRDAQFAFDAEYKAAMAQKDMFGEMLDRALELEKDKEKEKKPSGRRRARKKKEENKGEGRFIKRLDITPVPKLSKRLEKA